MGWGWHCRLCLGIQGSDHGLLPCELARPWGRVHGSRPANCVLYPLSGSSRDKHRKWPTTKRASSSFSCCSACLCALMPVIWAFSPRRVFSTSSFCLLASSASRFSLANRSSSQSLENICSSTSFCLFSSSLKAICAFRSSHTFFWWIQNNSARSS